MDPRTRTLSAAAASVMYSTIECIALWTEGRYSPGLRKVDSFRQPNEQTALNDRGDGALSRPDGLNYDCVGLMGEIVSFHTHTPLVSAQRRRYARETVVRRGKICVISVRGEGRGDSDHHPAPSDSCGFCEDLSRVGAGLPILPTHAC